ncbi:MAG: alpha/beta hydrolase, partial [Solobacterium sp.]|nr:alpha/beta hydrolase [Solobacterium sp.]
MRKGFLPMVLLCMALAGCGAESSRLGEEPETERMPQEVEREQDMTYTAQEITVQNGDLQIYGIAYVPDSEDKAPLVIFSHELGNDHTSGTRYAERLAEAGYAAYVFDFCGGTVGGNRSSGSNHTMSVLTEASDLEAVLAAAKTWDFVDPDRIILLGGSMGGLVTTVVGCTHQDDIAGMILLYPALSAKADSGVEKYQTEEEIPEDVSLFGGWMHVGRNYVTDLWKVDFEQLLASYQGHMLLLHGDKDSTVPLSYSEEAAKVIPDCEFHVIKDGRHEFSGQPFEDAMSYILAYLKDQLNEGNTESEETEMLIMKIGETEVEVQWEDNESVTALKELCEAEPLTIRMSMYGGFEQVGPIGHSLPRHDVQTTTQSGDIV